MPSKSEAAKARWEAARKRREAEKKKDEPKKRSMMDSIHNLLKGGRELVTRPTRAMDKAAKR